jgi:hypothetical protein
MSDLAIPPFDPNHFTPEGIAERLDEDRRQRRLKHRPANGLPVRPNLDYYRKQARSLHESQRKSDPLATLGAAQSVIARGLGCISWHALALTIQSRMRAADELKQALLRRDQKAIARIVTQHPHALVDAGCVATPEDLGVLLEIVPVSRHDSKLRTALLDAVAEHHDPEGLEECVRILTDWSDVDPDYADDVITERLMRAEESPSGAHVAELFENARGVLSWLTNPVDYSEYMSEDD